MKIDLTVIAYIIYRGKVLLTHHNKYNLWLPVGGHVEKDEDYESALLREIKEETGIDVEILNKSDIPVVGDTVKNLPLPFYSNVHTVKDSHSHCGLYYICRAKSDKINLNYNELKGFAWFSKEDLNQEQVPADVKAIAAKALEVYKKLEE
jgi:8-oxo-dGTP pyrophosphatase MutT (NUDIX family)